MDTGTLLGDVQMHPCMECNLNHQPLRSKHCLFCGHCVARYDHHCIWLGNCIGERNHGLFWWYLVCQTTVAFWGLFYVYCAVRLHVSEPGEGWIDLSEEFVWQNGLKVLLFTMVLICSWLPLCLLIYHSYLITTNQTTWEFTRRARISYLKQLAPDVRPFDHGYINNIILICCVPTLIDWSHPDHWTGQHEYFANP